MRISDYWYEYGGATVCRWISYRYANLQVWQQTQSTVRNAVDQVCHQISSGNNSIINRYGTGFTAAALSGDVSMDNTGDVTVGTLNQSTTGSSASCTGNSATATTQTQT